jgi:hypothetical protein
LWNHYCFCVHVFVLLVFEALPDVAVSRIEHSFEHATPERYWLVQTKNRLKETFLDISDAKADLQNSIGPGTTTDHPFHKKSKQGTMRYTSSYTRALYDEKMHFLYQFEELRVL